MGTKRSKPLLIIFFQEMKREGKEVMKAKLEVEWAKFKFDVDSWKSVLSSSVKDKPNEGKTTTTKANKRLHREALPHWNGLCNEG